MKLKGAGLEYDARVIRDIQHEGGTGLALSAATAECSIKRSIGSNWGTNLMLGSSSAGTIAAALDSIDGASQVVSYATTAGASYIQGTDGARVPITARRALLIPPARGSVPFRRYTMSAFVRIVTAGAVRMEMGLNQQGVIGGVGVSAIGAGWRYDSAENAGRWTPHYRLVAAGADNAGADSGIVSTDWHLLGLRFTDGPTPLLEWLIDGVPRFTLTNPAFVGTFTGQSCPLQFAGGAGVGSALHFTLPRLLIELA